MRLDMRLGMRLGVLPLLWAPLGALLPWTPANWLFRPTELRPGPPQDAPPQGGEDGWVRLCEMPEGWTSCGAPDDLFQWDAFSIQPNPPQRNRNATARVVGTLAEDIRGDATVDYLVKYGSLPIVRDTVDACEVLREYAMLPQCPLRAGHYDVTYGELLPLATPMGTYTVHAEGHVAQPDGSRRRIFCIEGVVVVRLFNPSLNQYYPDAADTSSSRSGQC